MLTCAIGRKPNLPNSAPCSEGTSRRRSQGSPARNMQPARHVARGSAIIPDGARGSVPHAGYRNGYVRPGKACDGCGRIADSLGSQKPNNQPQFPRAGPRKSTYRPIGPRFPARFPITVYFRGAFLGTLREPTRGRLPR
jgi:hypothetical protein